MYRLERHARGARFIAVMVAVGLIGALTAGCDNPIEGNGHDHTEEITGLSLSVGNQEVVRVEGGQVNDTLRVAEGESTGAIMVEFLDHDGEPVHTEDLEDDFQLALGIGNSAVADVELDGDWSFVLSGHSAGETTLVIELLHMPQAHSDFQTPNIPVLVR